MSTALAERSAQALAAPNVTPDQLDLIRRTIAKDATADELKLYLYDCARQGVHPLDKLLHFTKRGGKYTPVTSIDLMRTRAADTGEYAGSDDAVFDADGSPTFARVTVWRFVQGQRCAFTATARMSEYCPGAGQDHIWRKMPHTMLGKCAEALALRKGFPRQLSGLYAKEELDQAEPVAVTATVIDTPATVVDVKTGEDIPAAQAPEPPPGYHYVSGYDIKGEWHEAFLLKWDAQGGALKVSTKYQNVAQSLAKAAQEGVPVKANVTEKRNAKGEAYLNKVELWKAPPTEAEANAALDKEVAAQERARQAGEVA